MFKSLFFLAMLTQMKLMLLVKSSNFPPCTTTTFDTHGFVDLQSMLYDCSTNIGTPLDPPSYFSNVVGASDFEAVNVSLQLSLGSLINVDDLQSTMTMDVFLNLFWVDPRIFMPQLFQHLNPNCLSEGVDITSYVRNSANPLNFWLPDVYFYQLLSSTLIGESLKLLSNGTMYWSQHLLLVFPESSMNFTNYPRDVQNFSIILQSYSLDSDFLTLNYIGSGVETVSNPQSSGTSVSMNSIWSYNYFTAYISEYPSPSVTNPNRMYSTAYINLSFARREFGFVLRLAVPVTVFLVIVGLSFWGDVEKRVDVTLTMVLSVAALYLVIGTMVPMVGYLTLMDEFISTAFAMLSAVACLQFLSLTLKKLKDKYPMRDFLESVITYFLRFAAIPLAMAIFIISFGSDGFEVLISILCFTMAVLFYVGARNTKRLQIKFEKSILQLRIKATKFIYLAKNLISECKSLKNMDGKGLPAEEIDWTDNPLGSWREKQMEVTEDFCNKFCSESNDKPSEDERKRVDGIADLINKIEELDLSFFEVYLLKITSKLYPFGTKKVHIPCDLNTPSVLKASSD